MVLSDWAHDLQSGGSQALAELAYDLEAKDKIVAAGGLEAVFRSLHRHRSVTDTQVHSHSPMHPCGPTSYLKDPSKVQ